MMARVMLVSSTLDANAVMSMSAHCCVASDSDDITSWKEVQNDYKSLRHAVESNHQSIMEHALFTFFIEGMSRACSHQLVRHRVASVSQQSQRYVKMDGFEYVTPDSIKDFESKTASQLIEYVDGEGQYDYEPIMGTVQNAYKHIMEEINSIYTQMVKVGVPEEDARYILPNACCTNMVFTCNLRELKHIAEERLCERAQWEIRDIVEQMVDLANSTMDPIIVPLVPKCKTLGYCPEKKSCGRMPRKA